jgi:hypothetical protein
VLLVVFGWACAGAPADGESERAARTATVVGVVRLDGAGVEAVVEAVKRPGLAGVPIPAQSAHTIAPGFLSLARLMVSGPVTLPLPTPDRGPPAARTTSDASGRFTLTGLGAGEYALRATTTAGRRGSTHLEVPVAGAVLEKHVVLGQPAVRRVHGRIRHPGGRPYRGQVAAFHLSMAYTPASPAYATDAEGRFAFEVEVPTHFPNELHLGVLEPGRWAAIWTSDTSEAPVDLVLGDGVARSGVVREACTGRPVAGAEVVSTPRGGETGQPMRIERTFTDARGVFRLTQTTGAVPEVFVHARGYPMFMGALPADVVRLTPLPHRGRVRGRVVLPPGARLSPDLRVAVWGAELLGSIQVVELDAHGAFLVDVVSAEEGVVYAVGGGWYAKGVADLILEREGALPMLSASRGREIVLPLVRAGRVTGRVTGPNGKPVVGALLRLDLHHSDEQPIGSRPPGTEGLGRYAATGPDGRYTLEHLVPDLPYRIDVSSVGLAPTTTPVLRAASGTTVTADVALAAFGSLELTLVDDATGAPVVGARVTLYYRRSSTLDTGDGDPRTDAQGRLVFERLRSEPITATVIADGYPMLEGHPIPTAAGERSKHTVRLKRP